MSSNVIQFRPRQPANPAPEAPIRSTLRSEPQPDEREHAEAPDAVVEMVKQSAAMTLIATLAFYANQGYDGGQKARNAMPALKELMATKGIQLITS